MARKLLVINTGIFDGIDFLGTGYVLSENGIIKKVSMGKACLPFARGAKIHDLKGALLSPGLIDIHTHGAAGINTMEAKTTPQLLKMSKAYLKTGVTSVLITSFYDGKFLKRAALLKKFIQKLGPRSVPAGCYLEGPYINPEKRGMIPEKYILKPGAAMKEIQKAAGTLKIITFAPEIQGAMRAAKKASDGGAVAAFGHTAAGLITAKAALKSGVRHITHLFNAMDKLESGPYTAIAGSKKTSVEIIADGSHIRPEVVKMVYDKIGCGRLILISDSVPMLGCADGSYYDKEIGKFRIKNSAAYFRDGKLIGSAATLAQMCRNVKKWTGAKNGDVLRMVTSNPARLLGRDDIGFIKPGAKADFTVFDSGLKVQSVYKYGKKVF